MEWTVCLIPPDLTINKPAPESAWRAQTVDSRPLECIVWGRGTARAPAALLVRVGTLDEGFRRGGELYLEKGVPDENREEVGAVLAGMFPRLRHPTWEEIQSAADNAAPEGALFTIPPILAGSPGPDLEGNKWFGVQLTQVGAAEGSPAARHSMIATPGGLPHAN